MTALASSILFSFIEFRRFGNVKEPKAAKPAITIMSSINVKPLLLFLILDIFIRYPKPLGLQLYI